MNILLVGNGRIAKNHINAAIRNDVTIEAIIEKNIDKHILISNDKSYNALFLTDYQNTKINLSTIDYVVIATDSESHYEIATYFLNCSVPVLVEKPLGLSINELDNLKLLANRTGTKVSVCHQNRFNASVQRLHKSITQNNLGRLFYGVATIRWNRNEEYYSQADWRGKWKSDGGALMNQSIHNIDLLVWMMGSPVVEVFGYIDNKNHPTIEVEDMGLALLKFANGSFGIIESSMNTYPENFEETLSIFGEKGSVVLGGKSVNKIVHWNVKDDPIDDLIAFNEEVDSVYGNGHIALYKDFIEAIKEDREPAITLQDGRNAVEVILAIYKSSFEKRPISLPLPPETSTIMFEGKFFK